MKIIKLFSTTVEVIYYQILVILLVFCLGTLPATALNFYQAEAVYNKDTVFVAPPTGNREIDRVSILDALEQVKPGGTVQFAPGTYLIGEIISVKIPRVTLLGHSEGTTIRGCDPKEFVDPEDFFSCNGLELAGARQTVRGFTFEYAHWGLHLGCCFRERVTRTLPDGTSQSVPALYRTEGGHLVEGNTFRSTSSGIRVNGDWLEPAIIRNNYFFNNWHAVSINGHTVHLINNHISVPEPHLVPFFGFAWDGIKISPTLHLQGIDEPQMSACEGNIVEGNHIEGYLDGIRIELYFPRTSCRRNIVRANTIIVQRIKNPFFSDRYTLIDESDSTYVGVPISFLNEPAAFEGVEPEPGAGIENNIIEGNRIIGAEGIAIEVLHASRNRIANNSISGVINREPFPGNTMGIRGFRSMDFEWEKANGSGIWLSPGSNGNEIVNNTFKDVASAAVFIEGDSNRVEVQKADDIVRDLGTGNRVIGPEAEPTDPLYEEKFIEAGGVRLHYLDFGGDGLPVVFLHSESWDAYTYKDFAPRFADSNRVLALTRRGYGKSGGHGSGYDVPTQAKSILHFLDALGIERAVFAGNSSPTTCLTYLAEQHPERVAGLVYFAGLLPFWLLPEVQKADSTRMWEMAGRAFYNAAERERFRAQRNYRPDFLGGDRQQISVPALTFVGRHGTIGYERLSEPLWVVGSPFLRSVYREMPPSGLRDWMERLVEDDAFRNESLEKIPDSTARAYLLRLAADDSLQSALQTYQEEFVEPALVMGQEQFWNAFGENLRRVRLPAPMVEGYEYRDAPELIEPHIRRFLEEIEQNEKKRQK